MSSLSQYEEGSDQNQELSEADVSIDFTDDRMTPVTRKMKSKEFLMRPTRRVSSVLLS